MTNPDVLRLLAKEFPSADAVSAEIINLSAIVRLPKGTEYFFSDIHGEYNAFAYLLGTASGVIGDKIEQIFKSSVGSNERRELSSLIYTPEAFLASHSCMGDTEWCRVTMFRLIQVCKSVVSKYTRSKVRKKMPPRFAYVLDELLHADTEENKEDYFNGIIDSIIGTGVADTFIVALCHLIRKGCIDTLHILGDIFDRGPHADLVLDEMQMYDCDVQWGNHDIHWIGAALGSEVCVANVVRLATSYNNFDVLEDGYGINLRPLSGFAAETYKDDPCARFAPHLFDSNEFDPIDEALAAKMHKAIAVIQFKLEGALLARRPEYGMQARNLLPLVDFANGTITIEGKTHPLLDTSFPTVDPADPLALTPAEGELIRQLAHCFATSARLQGHIRFLLNNGSMYKIANGNLLYHGCIPMGPDGAFAPVTLDGKTLGGKQYLDAIDAKIRDIYYGRAGEDPYAADYLWYLWCGPASPLFGKSRLTAFERYFIADKATQTETYNPYYSYTNRPETAAYILESFGLDAETGHIINGHVPVRLEKGESPIKAGGRLFVIDGGISKAYSCQTGIGGYTLISSSHSLQLAQHRPFAQVLAQGLGAPPTVEIVERYPRRVSVRDTNTGAALTASIGELTALLRAYRSGAIQEKI